MTTERLALASADWKRRAVDGFWWIAGRSALDEALRLLIFLALARQLAPEAFGVVALFGVALAALSLVVEQGLGRALVQRDSPAAAHFDSVFWLQSVLALTICTALTAGGQTVATLLDLAPHAAALQVLVWSLLFQAIRTVPLARLERDFRARALALSRLAGTLSGGAAALAIAASGGGLWSLVAQQLISAAVETWDCAQRAGGGPGARCDPPRCSSCSASAAGSPASLR
jgi:O-antigen/teichoic acid export membrane protein